MCESDNVIDITKSMNRDRPAVMRVQRPREQTARFLLKSWDGAASSQQHPEARKREGGSASCRAWLPSIDAWILVLAPGKWEREKGLCAGGFYGSGLKVAHIA